MRLIVIILLVVSGVSFSGLVNWFNLNEPEKDRITGVSFVAPVKGLDPACFNPIKEIGASWIAFIPYAYGKYGFPKLSFNNEWQWWGETTVGVRKCVLEAKIKGFKVMIKPQIWFRGGDYTGDFMLDNDLKWREFEKYYEKYILDYAILSDSLNVDILCIGTELKSFVRVRPEFWADLIMKCREVYKGKIVYAANWDSYRMFPHWSELDYIGIDSYFPLCNKREPTLISLEEGWKQHFAEISDHASKNNKQVIFTEFGYRSVDFCAKSPWDSSTSGNKTVNLEAQSLAFESVFRTFWDKDWFAGGFVWKWYANHEKSGGHTDSRFTPQNKPVINVIKKYYCGDKDCP